MYISTIFIWRRKEQFVLDNFAQGIRHWVYLQSLWERKCIYGGMSGTESVCPCHEKSNLCADVPHSLSDLNFRSIVLFTDVRNLVKSPGICFRNIRLLSFCIASYSLENGTHIINVSKKQALLMILLCKLYLS